VTSVRVREISEQEALKLFKGWFHNKMNIILIMSQYPHLRRKESGTHNQLSFLHDIEHHFLDQESEKKIFFDAIRWLKAFFHVHPERITPKRSKSALKMIKIVYDAFGFPFHWNDGHLQVKNMVVGGNGYDQKGSGEKTCVSGGAQRVLCQALAETRALLKGSKGAARDDEIHHVKSLLYAALERLGMTAERLFSVQRMLRELFSIVTSSYDFKDRERKVGLQILDEIEERYFHP